MPQSINPYTLEVLSDYPEYDPKTVEAKLATADRAYLSWRKAGYERRIEVLNRMSELLEAELDTHASLISAEMGKSIGEARGEVKKCAWLCRYLAEEGPAMLQPDVRESDASHSYVRYDPIGAVLIVMPWNFPYWQVFRQVAPSLMAGNVIVLKHASNVTGCGLAMEKLVAEACGEEGLLSTLVIGSSRVAGVLADPRIKAASVTGSEKAGQSVAENAGKHLKKTVLELGGSDPFIVLADADLEKAVEWGVKARMQNAGQSCIAAKRFIVHESLFDVFIEGFVNQAQQIKLGDPSDETTQMGTMARADLGKELHEQVKDALGKGAALHCGGELWGDKQQFYQPTVLSGITPKMRAHQEELFGPVAMIYTFDTEEEAIQLANGTPFGLGASLWTSSQKVIERLVPQIETGAVFANGMVKSDPRLPFGGVKTSGYGRELAREGLLEFTNQKTVWIA